MSFGEDRDRTRRLRDVLGANNVDALLVQLPENVCYTSDYWPLLGLTWVFFPKEGDPVLFHNNFETEADTWIKDVRTFVAESISEVADPLGGATERIKEVIEERRLKRARIGYEGSFQSVGTGYLRYRANNVMYSSALLKARIPGVDWVDATQMLYGARSVKTDVELQKLRLANEVSGFGLDAFYNGLREGTSEIALATAIENQAVLEGTGYKGARHIMACAFLSSGEFTAQTYGVCFGNSTRRIRMGDFAMLEFDVVVDGYTSDMSRTYVLGRPDQKQRHLLEAVYEAQVEAVRIETDGITASQVCQKADDVLRKHGYGDNIKHYLGHGIGVTIWEPIPYLHSKSTDILRAGMVHSAEPGAYVPGFGGARIEDNIYLSDKGPVYLSDYMPIQEW